MAEPTRLPAPLRKIVLVTRPEPGASETARRLAALGWTPLVAPMLATMPRSTRLPRRDSVQAVLVTSAASLTGLGHELLDRKVFAVGDATASLARAAGFAEVESAGADAAALARLVAARCDPAGASLLLAAGERHGAPLAAALRAGGFRVQRRTLYTTRAATVLPEPVRAALAARAVSVATFFSPATARAFVHLVCATRGSEAVSGIEALAISVATRAALAPLPWQRIRVASRPNQDELLALLQ